MRQIQRLLALAPALAIFACTDATSSTNPTNVGVHPPTALNASIDVGYGPDLFYYFRRDPASFNFSTFGTISTSGTHTDRFGVGSNFDAVTFAPANVGYGTNLFYYVRHDPASFNFSTFGTISTSGAVTDRFGVGSDFVALTFAGTDLGYGPNLFYYLRHDPAIGIGTWFGTISTSGAVVDRFQVGIDFNALVFVAADLGYGPNLFYYLRRSSWLGNLSTFGTISTEGFVNDRFDVGSNFDALAFAPPDLGYGAALFYFLRHDPASSNFSTFGTISVSGSVTDRFGVGNNFNALTFPASPPAPQAILFSSTPPDPAVIGNSYAVTATGGASGNPVTFSSQTPSVCAVSGFAVTLVAPGICSVAADQAGSATYDPAPTVTQTFPVTTIAQLITDTRTMLQTLGLEREIAKNLDGKLNEVLKSLGKQKTKEVCNGLKATLNEIVAQTGKKLTSSQAAALTAQVNLIRQLVGC